MKEYSVVGKATRNIDGVAKVTGEARYTFDMTLPGMLYGKLLRSPHPHARIISIDTSEAERLPGVKESSQGRIHPAENMALGDAFPSLWMRRLLSQLRFVS